MVHALTLSIAQRLAWSLAASLMACVVRAGRSYGVMPEADFDGDSEAVIAKYDPLAGNAPLSGDPALGRRGAGSGEALCRLQHRQQDPLPAAPIVHRPLDLRAASAGPR